MKRTKDEAATEAAAMMATDIPPMLEGYLPIPDPLASIGHSEEATGVLVVGLFSLANVTILNEWQSKFNAHVARFNALVDALTDAGAIAE